MKDLNSKQSSNTDAPLSGLAKNSYHSQLEFEYIVIRIPVSGTLSPYCSFDLGE